MSERTNIEWANHTASPWFGCSKVSPGCTHCYAEELTLKYKWAGWGDNAPRVKGKSFWRDVYKWNQRSICGTCDTSVIPVYSRSRDLVCPECATMNDFHRPRIFTSLMDWLDEKAPIEWLADFLKVIHECENLDWLLLTKRPENFHRVQEALDSMKECSCDFETWIQQWVDGFPPANVWLGCTVEDEARKRERVPILLDTPAKVRWLSVEPLLEPVFLNENFWLDGRARRQDKTLMPPGTHPHIDWVVVGGESGRNRRDCGVQAIVNVAEQCKDAGVPIFVKQDVGLKPGQQGRIPDEVWQLKQYPNVCR